MTVTPQAIDSVFEQMRKYSVEHMGLANGEDFAALAQALQDSPKFINQVKAAAVIGMLGALTMPKKTEGATDEDIDKIFADTPLKRTLAEMFYAGYKAGVATSEVRQLESLAKP